MNRYTNCEDPQYKCCNAYGNGEAIANIPGAVIKPYFKVKMLAAYSACIIHFHKMFQVIWVRVREHFTPAAAWTLRFAHAYQERRFFIV